MISRFPELFARLELSARPESLSADLFAPLRSAYEAIVERPYDPARVAVTVERLLVFLSSPAGRTDANCRAVDFFFCLGEDWERAWEDEPAELSDILADMGGALHDAVRDLAIAENFESTPEILLDRVRAFRARSATV